jgi:hypothetical protein
MDGAPPVVMSNSGIVTDALHQRLRLAVGARAELGEEIPGVGCRAFRATLADGGPAVAAVYRAPPEGPEPKAIGARVDAVRELAHGLIDVPLAAADLDGHTWVIEAASPLPTARERLGTGMPPLTQGVSAIRDLCRALVALHRRGIAHGSITLDTVRINSDGARLGGISRSLGGSVRSDLDALGDVTWALLTGETNGRSSRPLSKIRGGVAPGLEALCLAFAATDPRHRPQSASAVLEALDSVPTRRARPLSSIVDAGMNDGRPRRAVVWLVVGAAFLLLLALLQSRA